MVDSIAVPLPNSITTIYTDALLIIAGKFFKRFQQHTVFISEAQICILDLLGRDERILITDGLIVFVDLGTDIIQMAVNAVGLNALAFTPF
nr:hypothetical protein [Alistipes onderdonkii]